MDTQLRQKDFKATASKTPTFFYVLMGILCVMCEFWRKLPTIVITSHGIPSSGLDKVGDAFRKLGVDVISVCDGLSAADKHASLERQVQEATAIGPKVIYVETTGSKPERDMKNLFRKCNVLFLKLRLPNTFRFFATCLLRESKKTGDDVSLEAFSTVWTVYRQLVNKFEDNVSNDTTPTEDFLLFICQKAFGLEGIPKGKRLTSTEINEFVRRHGLSKFNSVYTKMYLQSLTSGKSVLYHLVKDVSSIDHNNNQNDKVFEEYAKRYLRRVAYEWKCFSLQMIANSQT